MKRLIIAFLLLIFIFVLTFVWWKNGLLPANPSDRTPHIFVVKKGESVREIISGLKQEGLIKDSVVFFLLTKKLGLDKQIQAGDFRLNPSMNANEIITSLQSGTLDIWTTIPEGQRADEIADTLKSNIPSYQESWRETLNQNEGYLFPDTYLIPRDADINLILSLMKGNFEKKYQTVVNAKTTKYTDEQTVIIASLIEREGKSDIDRPLISSVIANRLDLGMALQVDATVQYVVGYQPNEKTWWKKDLTFEDLQTASLYNTYENPGLPPSPIANPGLSAIKAALDPSNTEYLYYFSDKNGIFHFSKTLEEHNAGIKKYGL